MVVIAAFKKGKKKGKRVNKERKFGSKNRGIKMNFCAISCFSFFWERRN